MTYLWVHDAIKSVDLTYVRVLKWWKSDAAISIVHEASVSNQDEAHEEIVVCDTMLVLFSPSVGMRVVRIVGEVDSLPVRTVSRESCVKPCLAFIDLFRWDTLGTVE